MLGLLSFLLKLIDFFLKSFLLDIILCSSICNRLILLQNIHQLALQVLSHALLDAFILFLLLLDPLALFLLSLLNSLLILSTLVNLLLDLLHHLALLLSFGLCNLDKLFLTLSHAEYGGLLPQRDQLEQGISLFLSYLLLNRLEHIRLTLKESFIGLLLFL